MSTARDQAVKKLTAYLRSAHAVRTNNPTEYFWNDGCSTEVAQIVDDIIKAARCGPCSEATPVMPPPGLPSPQEVSKVWEMESALYLAAKILETYPKDPGAVWAAKVARHTLRYYP
ncbi:MAG TPA: hypothetical protein VMR25_14620 [Planctomycetaceae bacterium]|nr:hypothetical protein [Planctomycetaceae bacterium]